MYLKAKNSEMMGMAGNGMEASKKFQCKLCEDRFETINDMIQHLVDGHNFDPSSSGFKKIQKLGKKIEKLPMDYFMKYLLDGKVPPVFKKMEKLCRKLEHESSK